VADTVNLIYQRGVHPPIERDIYPDTTGPRLQKMTCVDDTEVGDIDEMEVA
jgi:hypothetical protein